MELMPTYDSLTTEHIKSHLQKYRIQNSKSKDEFLEFYEGNIRGPFESFVVEKGWKREWMPQPSRCKSHNIWSPDIALRPTCTPVLYSLPSSTYTSNTHDNQSTSSTTTGNINNPITSNVVSESEEIVSKWCNIFEELLTEHAYVQQTLKISMEGQKCAIFDNLNTTEV